MGLSETGGPTRSSTSIATKSLRGLGSLRDRGCTISLITMEPTTERRGTLWRLSRTLVLTYLLGTLLVVIVYLLAHVLFGRGQALIGLLVVPGGASVTLGLLMIFFPHRLSSLNREAARVTTAFGFISPRLYYHPVAYLLRGLWCILIGTSLFIGGLVLGFGLDI